jgi:hypothetical protein
MKRFWILLGTEFKAWRRDPITALGGFIPPTLILIAFGLLLGGRLSFKLAVIDHDEGSYGAVLHETFAEVISPFGVPYYDVLDLPEEEARETYHAYRIDGLWVIPRDFSSRLEAGENPAIEMYFINYNDDRAKNHRIYSAEILWRFYEKIGQPAPPIALAEVYPRPEMVHWFPVIAIGVTLLAVTLGAAFNIYALTYKEQIFKLTLEFGLAPRSLLWVLLPKTLLALIAGIVTGTTFLGILYIWLGVWPGRFLWAVWLLFGLVALFWIALALAVGLRARSYMPGAIGAVLGALIVFFVSGGLNLWRWNAHNVNWFSWLFPYIYAVDPLRDMILFNTWPADWKSALTITGAFAAGALTMGWSFAGFQLRHSD